MTKKRGIKLNQIRNKLFVLLVIVSFILPTFGYTMVVAEEQAYQDISIDIANEMIENKKKNPNLVILDVRTECEYDKGHLFDAFLLPHDELESRLNELEEYRHFDVIVYCKSGERSQQASQILSQNGFTNIYNMLGGILAWLDLDYPIYTSSHYVTVDKIKNKPIIQIDPLIKSRYICCSDNQPNQTNIEIPKINYTISILVDEENYSETLITSEYNNSITEYTIFKTQLFDYEEITDKSNRTVNYIFTQIIAEDLSISYYTMKYFTQQIDYNLTVSTTLTPLDTQTYNSSYTSMIYEPVNKSEISMEIIKFNFSTTLSEKYSILGKVAKEIGKVYKKSKDETLTQFTKGYYIMEKEVKYLSKLVKNQLQEYDYQILESHSILLDAYVENGGGGGGVDHPVNGISCPLCVFAFNAGSIIACALVLYVSPLSYVICLEAIHLMELGMVARLLCRAWGYC